MHYLNESALVLSYRNSLPGNLQQKWVDDNDSNKEDKLDMEEFLSKYPDLDPRSATARAYMKRQGFYRSFWRVLRRLNLVFVSGLIAAGTLPIFFQRLIMQIIQPLVIAIVGYFAIILIQQPELFFSILAVILVLGGLWFFKFAISSIKKHRLRMQKVAISKRKEEKEQKSVVVVPKTNKRAGLMGGLLQAKDTNLSDIGSAIDSDSIEFSSSSSDYQSSDSSSDSESINSSDVSTDSDTDSDSSSPENEDNASSPLGRENGKSSFTPRSLAIYDAIKQKNKNIAAKGKEKVKGDLESVVSIMSASSSESSLESYDSLGGLRGGGEVRPAEVSNNDDNNDNNKTKTKSALQKALSLATDTANKEKALIEKEKGAIKALTSTSSSLLARSQKLREAGEKLDKNGTIGSAREKLKVNKKFVPLKLQKKVPKVAKEKSPKESLDDDLLKERSQTKKVQEIKQSMSLSLGATHTQEMDLEAELEAMLQHHNQYKQENKLHAIVNSAPLSVVTQSNTGPNTGLGAASDTNRDLDLDLDMELDLHMRSMGMGGDLSLDLHDDSDRNRNAAMDAALADFDVGELSGFNRNDMSAEALQRELDDL